ncbi:acetylglucosaminyltransferase [Volvox carteri f. nagariensis]|uniref:Acetylglucosaminyltransferase n=1 Tax=Volvox carteri f. nagariensis TaxID=3068 RepID=D8UHC7_VOLCA|nr:acetylglucosaminyltransferase [Volvox carteri f. nagariensis]EFJ40906.1 acetylglucosaminyltransferase [Volvox carteri f. nagariensis]|eukprot:XP_002958066.1 acetylglucosaminyltransferase [Volvox carteri f. nagariensis]
MAGFISRNNRSGPAVNLYWSAYLIGSVILLVVLSLDPYFNKPSGWIGLELFTSKPVRHGVDPCSWDYEGSWKIGSFSGPNPMALNISTEPLITCADVTPASVSYVRAPFVHVPGDDEPLEASTWTVFYEMRNLQTHNSEIGASVSHDGGVTWRHAGVALADRRTSLSSPFVVYDAPSKLYVMLPNAQSSPSWFGSSRSRGGSSLRAYVTTAVEFPLGWRPLSGPLIPSSLAAGDSSSSSPDTAVTSNAAGGPGAAATATSARRLGNPDSGTAATRGSWDGAAALLRHGEEERAASGASGGSGSWGPGEEVGGSGQLSGTTAVLVEGRWWVFTSLVQPAALPWLRPRVTPRIYLTEGSSLLSEWIPHPAADQLHHPGGGPVWSRPSGEEEGREEGSGGAGEAGVAEGTQVFSSGRPFLWRGAVHRWVHGCKRHCGDELLLLRAVVANATDYAEEVAARYEPGSDRSWHAQRLTHADVRPLPVPEEEVEGGGGGGGERWWGLVSADRYADGMHQFVVHELWFVELKASLRNLVAMQLLLVLGVVVLRATAEGGGGAGGGGGGKGRHGSLREADDGGKCGSTVVSSWWCRGLDATLRIWAVQLLSRSPTGVAALSVAEAAGRTAHAAVVKTVAAWDLFDVSCRRLASQPRAQFAAHAVGACVIGLTVAAAVMVAVPSAVPCPRWMVVIRPFTDPPYYTPPQPFVDPSAPFNLTRLTVVSGCTMSFMDRLENLVGSLQYWEPDLPIVVYDLGFTSEQLARLRCWRGVEVIRGPLDSLKAVLARDGYASAQQSGSPSDYSYTEKYSVPFFNMTDQDYQRVKKQPFCASGLQGWVRGAASQQLLLGPAVACALAINCTAPPGHSRANHLYEQTALTLHIRLNNYSSCMPRETHCTSAVKKVSWDPTASSAPIVAASRRHRWPKPYRHRVASRPGCIPDPAGNPWRSVSSEHSETVTKSSSLLFKIGFVYGQAVGDFIIQASCCLGLHVVAQGVLLAALLVGEVRRRSLLSRGGGQTALSPAAAAAGGSGAWGTSWLWLCRPQPLLAGLLLMVLLMGLSMVTSCRAL